MHMGAFSRLIFLYALLSAASGCVTSGGKDEVPIAADAAVRGIPSHIKDRPGWSQDIIRAVEAAGKVPTTERYCAVVAVIGQESGFQPDPVVRNLPQIVRKGLLEKFTPLGPLAEPAMNALLAGKPPGSDETFARQINRLRTERDLDRMFRDVAAAYREQFPGTFIISTALAKLLGKGGLADLNPVTTAGSMQVKVSFARTTRPFEDLSEEGAREKLYTRAGGVLAGTIRLLHYEADYDDIIYRFADYNAGEYAARNAAFQEMLSQLLQEPLVLDGDLLAYDKFGRQTLRETNSLQAMLRFGAMQGLSPNQIRKDARDEKDADFEDTDIWESVRSAWEEKHRREPPYARMPQLTLTSPKLQRSRSTAWFARNVKIRHDKCLAAAGQSSTAH
jgi:hypothetical protein